MNASSEILPSSTPTGIKQVLTGKQNSNKNRQWTAKRCQEANLKHKQTNKQTEKNKKRKTQQEQDKKQNREQTFYIRS